MTARRRLLHYLGAALVLGLFWQACSLAVGGDLLPRPLEALAGFAQAVQGRDFWRHFGASALRAVAAMAAAWALGFPLGVLLGGSRRADALLSPLVFLTYPVPKIVLLPVFLLVFGLGDASRVAMIGLILWYQVVVTTRDGVRAIHPRHFDTIRSLGGGRRHLLLEALVPGALPHAFTALRLSTGVSVAVLFFVESFATTEGLGFLIMDRWGRMDYAGMFTGILGMSLLGVTLYEAVELLERKACAWTASRRA